MSDAIFHAAEEPLEEWERELLQGAPETAWPIEDTERPEWMEAMEELQFQTQAWLNPGQSN